MCLTTRRPALAGCNYDAVVVAVVAAAINRKHRILLHLPSLVLTLETDSITGRDRRPTSKHETLKMRLYFVTLVLVLYVTSLEVIEAARNRGKKYRTSSTYLDSYQYPGIRNGEDLDQFSGDDDQETLPDVYYGKDSVYGRNSYGGGQNTRTPDNYGGNFYGSRFDFEGSGNSIPEDDMEVEEEGSGYGTLTDDEDIFRITTTPRATTTNIFYQTTSTERGLDYNEGSGSGDFDNDDEWDDEDQHSIPKITVPSRAPTRPPPSTTLDFGFADTTTVKTTVKTTERTTVITTPTTTQTTRTTARPTTKTTARPSWPESTQRPLWPESTQRPLWPTWPTTTSSTTTTTTTTTTYRARRPTFETPSEPSEGSEDDKETEIPKFFGPNKEKVPTPLMENRMAIIIAYTASILLLLIFILIVLCMLMRYHKRPPSEVSSDTASSDLPMLKPDAKRYHPGIIRRQNSESPPPLPDLNLFDEPPKYSDLSRGGRVGSLRKSKRDLKNSTPPNWL